jgi:hypothetical protein
MRQSSNEVSQIKTNQYAQSRTQLKQLTALYESLLILHKRRVHFELAGQHVVCVDVCVVRRVCEVEE